MAHARQNSEIRVPPAMLAAMEEVLARVVGLLWAEARADEPEPQVLTAEVIPADLEGWSYLGRWGLTAAEAERRLPVSLRSVKFELRGRSPDKSRGLFVSSGHQPVRIILYLFSGFHPWVLWSTRTAQGLKRELRGPLVHELRHYTQALLAAFSGSGQAGTRGGVSGRPGGRGPHARRPEEFYPLLGDAVWATVGRVSDLIEREKAWLAEGPEEGETPEELEAQILRQLHKRIQEEGTFTALEGTPTYPKMVSEFVSQVNEQVAPLLAGYKTAYKGAGLKAYDLYAKSWRKSPRLVARFNKGKAPPRG